MHGNAGSVTIISGNTSTADVQQVDALPHTSHCVFSLVDGARGTRHPTADNREHKHTSGEAVCYLLRLAVPHRDGTVVAGRLNNTVFDAVGGCVCGRCEKWRATRHWTRMFPGGIWSRCVRLRVDAGHDARPCVGGRLGRLPMERRGAEAEPDARATAHRSAPEEVLTGGI